jgi:hypothetical protein
MTEPNLPIEFPVRTLEQITKSINAAFDSVNLINSIVSKPFQANKDKRVKSNVEHLSLMLSKDWFLAGLTPEQKSQIDACIVAGNNYSAE